MKFPVAKFPVAKCNAAKISPGEIFCGEISGSQIYREKPHISCLKTSKAVKKPYLKYLTNRRKFNNNHRREIPITTFFARFDVQREATY